MADENLIDGHDAAWWKGQREQLKVELDKLNPTLDAATAKLQTQALQIADLERRLAEAEKAHAATKAERDTLGSALTVRTVEKDQAHEIASGAEANLRQCAADLNAAKALAEKRRLALADLLKQHSDGIARLMPLVTE